MVSVEQEHLVVLLEAGYLLLAMGRYGEAAEVFEGAAVFLPESEVPLVSLGSVFFAQHKFDQAIRCYRKGLKVHPTSAFAHSRMGEALFFQGKKGEALDELKYASQCDPHGSSGEFARALLQIIESGFTPPLKPAPTGGSAT